MGIFDVFLHKFIKEQTKFNMSVPFVRSSVYQDHKVQCFLLELKPSYHSLFSRSRVANRVAVFEGSPIRYNEAAKTLKLTLVANALQTCN